MSKHHEEYEKLLVELRGLPKDVLDSAVAHAKKLYVECLVDDMITQIALFNNSNTHTQIAPYLW
jgi:hypothetical protein